MTKMFISKKALNSITDRIADLEKSQEVQEFEREYPNGRLTMRNRFSFAPERVYEYSYGGKLRQVRLPISSDCPCKLCGTSLNEERVIIWLRLYGRCNYSKMECYCFSHGSAIAAEIDADAILKTKPEE